MGQHSRTGTWHCVCDGLMVNAAIYLMSLPYIQGGHKVTWCCVHNILKKEKRSLHGLMQFTLWNGGQDNDRKVTSRASSTEKLFPFTVTHYSFYLTKSCLMFINNMNQTLASTWSFQLQKNAKKLKNLSLAHSHTSVSLPFIIQQCNWSKHTPSKMEPNCLDSKVWLLMCLKDSNKNAISLLHWVIHGAIFIHVHERN